ncbi:MAG: hypothetical protein JOY62_15155 [Acidobacteriaceae bacterium]|nr:hypothetical protein [Acidobacteriaceae bacterium]MBV9781300.1 hypothetical protein [Acidobacteriaceae bacterium]
MTGLIARTSTIFIATDAGTRVYRSMAEVPAPLRQKLRASTKGMNSATILIADRRGREELIRALQGQPSEVWSLLAKIRSRQSEKKPAKGKRGLPALRTWLELLLPLVIGASLWVLIDLHYW